MLLHLGALLVMRQVRGRGALSWLAASYSLSTHSVHMDGGVSVAEAQQDGAKMLVTQGTQGHGGQPAMGLFRYLHCFLQPASQPPGLCLADGEKPGSRDVIPMEALGPGEC